MCRAVHTGSPADHYANRLLSGGTADLGCFIPVTTRNRLVTIDFDRWRPISDGISRGRKKEEEGEEKPGDGAALRPCYPSPSSPARSVARLCVWLGSGGIVPYRAELGMSVRISTTNLGFN
ncbi:hypothetical protein GW17_00001235 [Ensete ventricosum]|nr:hypothetical protein GW17_00001235 [Ensete ventricosum]